MGAVFEKGVPASGPQRSLGWYCKVWRNQVEMVPRLLKRVQRLIWRSIRLN